MKIITLSGKAGHGKDLSAQILKEKLENNDNKVLILHYADLLKFYCKAYFGWDGVKDEKGRSILQWMGTEKVRAKDENFWVDSVIRLINVFEDDYDYFIIADCRFPSEINRLIECNFDVLTIKLDRINYKNNLTDEQRLHPSETALNNFEFDLELYIEEGIDKLIESMDEVVEVYLS